jgi:hypothetical protein
MICSISSDHSRQGPDIGASDASLAVGELRNYWLKHGNGVCETVVAGVGQINASLFCRAKALISSKIMSMH